MRAYIPLNSAGPRPSACCSPIRSHTGKCEFQTVSFRKKTLPGRITLEARFQAFDTIILYGPWHYACESG